MDLTSSIRGLSLLFLAIIGNFLGNTMNCSLQRILTNSAIGRNVVIYFLIYFTVNYTSVQQHPMQNFGNAFLIYLLYVLLEKQNIYFFLISIVLLFTIYVISQFKDYYNYNIDKKDSEKETIKKLDLANLILLIILICTLLIGICMYAMKQINEKEDFDILTFLFGSNQCDFLNTVKKYSRVD